MRDMLEKRVLGGTVEAVGSFIRDRIRRDAEARVRFLVAVTEALEQRLGQEEGFRVAREVHERLAGERRAKPAKEGEDRGVQAFCEALEAGCIGTHEWERTEDTPERVAYRFTRCTWAELFRALGRPDIGHWFCDGDESAARSFNPRIGFQRTQVLMDGAPCCDHVFYLETQ
jgi:hypothetical protein